MQTPLPVLGYGVSQSKLRIGKKDRKILAALLAVFLLICGFHLVKSWRIQLRHRYQAGVLNAMLAEKGARFRKVHVICIETMPQVIVEGEVQTDNDMNQLHSEMVKRLGKEVGRTAIYNVWSVSSGAVWEGDREELSSK